MNKFEALKVFGLNKINQELIKSTYRKLSQKYHPDKGGSVEMMKVLNVAYDFLKHLQDDVNYIDNETVDNININFGDELNAAINAVIHLQGIIIEVCGTWIWISGDTKPHKEILKQAGFKWGAKKKQWYFRDQEYKSFNRKSRSMEWIRSKYGSAEVKNMKYKEIA